MILKKKGRNRTSTMTPTKGFSPHGRTRKKKEAEKGGRTGVKGSKKWKTFAQYCNLGGI